MTGTANLLNGLAHEAGDATSECARLLAEWRQAVADHVAAVHADVEGASCTAADKRKDDIAHRAWATPVSDPVRLRLLAQIVRDSLWPDLDRNAESRFENLLAGEDPEDDPVVSTFDERAVAELVRSVLWTGAAPSRAGRQPRASGDVRDLCQTAWNFDP